MTGLANTSARGRAPGGDEAALRDRLGSADPVERRDAALGLVDAAASDLATATVEALAGRARRDDDADVRQFAVEALGVAAAGRPVIEDALDDAEPWVRAEAVVALSRAADGLPDALRRGLDDDDGWVRRNALIALGKAEALDAATLRARLKDDPHPPVREFAAGYLAETPGEVAETVTALAAVLARDPDAFVRAKAATSLGELGTERAIEALESQGLPDRSDDVQRAAKQALARARGKATGEMAGDDWDSRPDEPRGRSGRPSGGRRR